MKHKLRLLCTFTDQSKIDSTVNEIQNFYTVFNNKFFIFSDIKGESFFITYNIITDDSKFNKFPNTIIVHRKKIENVIYTINSMNQIIKDENGGIFDPTYKVNWELYKNSLILTGEPFIKIISIKLVDIIG